MDRPDDRLVRFLLGTASDAERDAIERECLRPDLTTFDELAALEDELRVDYVQGALTTAERHQYERRFLSGPDAADRLAFARALAAKAARPVHDVPARWWARPSLAIAMAAAATLFAVTSIVLLERSHRLEIAVQQARGGPDRAAPATMPSAPGTPPARPTAPATPPSAVALSLLPVLTRGPGNPTPAVRASAAAAGLHLVLHLPDGAPQATTYPVSITDPDGHAVWTGVSRRDGTTAIVDVPRALPPNDYQIDLKTSSGDAAGIATYALRIQRD